MKINPFKQKDVILVYSSTYLWSGDDWFIELIFEARGYFLSHFCKWLFHDLIFLDQIFFSIFSIYTIEICRLFSMINQIISKAWICSFHSHTYVCVYHFAKHLCYSADHLIDYL